MSAKVICMASAKGGSGKTVLTATFAAFLCNLDKRVLMIDTDAATNGLTLMFLKEARLQGEVAASQKRRPRGVYERTGDEECEIVRVPSGADFIPATYSFINTEKTPVKQFALSLEALLVFAREDYDYVFLDAQAGSDLFAYVVMAQETSDEVIIVSEYDPLSAAGIERLKGLFREDLTYVRTWILLNKMLPDFVKSFSDFMEVAKYASPIPWDADVVRAYARRKLALDLETGNEFTLAIVQALRSILGEQIGSELDKWLSSRAAALREPIEVQYQDVERRLAELVHERAQSQKGDLNKRSRRLALGAALVAILAGVASVSAHVMGRSLHFEQVVGSRSALDILAITGTFLILIVLLVVTYSESLKSTRADPEREVSAARFDRQYRMLQDRLQKLETLKSAEVDTLIKHAYKH